MITDAIAQVLNWLYGIWPSYAGDIMLLTLMIMVIVTPLTLKGTRSMMEMQKHQPEIRKLQAQYKDDRQRLNEEMMAFYKEHNINPVGGCLPLLIQMPVFIALYSVLRGLTRRVSDEGFDLGWVAGQQAQGLPLSEPPATDFPFDPAYLGSDSALYQSLAGETTMQSWGLDLSESLSQALGEGLLHALPYLLLVGVVAVTGVIQQRQIQGRNPNAEINPQQQMIMKFMPIMLPVISFGLPSGLVLYFAVSNTYRCGQQWWISRSIYGISKDETAKTGGVRGLLGRSSSTAGALDVASTETKPDGKGRPTPKRTDSQRSPSLEKKDGGRGTKTSSPKAGKSGKSPGKSSGRTGGRAGQARGSTASEPPKPVTAQPRARKRKR